MTYLTVRSISPALSAALEREKRRRGCSLNQLVLDLLQGSLGLAPAATRSNGLAKLAGTWSREDLEAFERGIAETSRIDEELWR